MSLDRGAMGRLSVQRLSKRFTRNREYDRVDDTQDTRVPLYNEEAFQHGLKFKAKYIGNAEIAKPSSKLDIITAMRRIRYDNKVNRVKKQRCFIDISTQGVKVSKRKRGRRKQYTEDDLFMMQHAIYRIFYVSHDSQDLKIFSYITREVPNNVFKCNVFKAYKKRMALHVVRSLGQAFDVCHKLNPRPKKKKSAVAAEEQKVDQEKKPETEEAEETEEKPKEPSSDIKDMSKPQIDPNSTDPFTPGGGAADSNGLPPLIDLDPLAAFNLPTLPPMPPSIEPSIPLATYVGRPRPRPGQNVIQENPMIPFSDSVQANISPAVSIGEPLSDTDGAVPQWELERQQMRAQLTLLTDQLHAERTSKIESEARVEHLLMQNKELLSHLQKLMVQLQQLQSLQMSQITGTAAKTETKTPQSSKGPTPLDMTPPKSEPSEAKLSFQEDNGLSKTVPNISDELPLLDDIATPIAPEATPQTSREDDENRAFTPQGSGDHSQLLSHDQSDFDATFWPHSSSPPPPPSTAQEEASAFIPQETQTRPVSSSPNDQDAAFIPQESSIDQDLAFTPQESSHDQTQLMSHDQATLDAAFTPNTVSVAS